MPSHRDWIFGSFHSWRYFPIIMHVIVELLPVYFESGYYMLCQLDHRETPRNHEIWPGMLEPRCRDQDQRILIIAVTCNLLFALALNLNLWDHLPV